MKILITGRDGLVGSTACRVYERLGDQVLGYSRTEFDITDSFRTVEVLEAEKPDVLVNCAAYTDVDGAESNHEQNESVNALGPSILAKSCRDLGISFVTISTDYVFDGQFDGFYTESHNPNPISKYGQAKLLGEQLALEQNSETIVARTGWVFGKVGTNFLCMVPTLLSEKKEFFAIEDSFGTPTYADDLVLKIRELSEANASGLFHLSNSGNGTSYDGFAMECANALGVESATWKTVSEESLKRAAKRPKNSRMISERLREFGVSPLRNWRAAVNDFVRG